MFCALSTRYIGKLWLYFCWNDSSPQSRVLSEFIAYSVSKNKNSHVFVTVFKIYSGVDTSHVP